MGFSKAKCKQAFLKLGMFGAPGSGKAQPLDTPILTPKGWTRMGDLSPGDLVVGSNGLPTSVISVHPQGVKDVFRVTFTDGSSTECCDDHLWLTRTALDRSAKRPGSVKSLQSIRGTLVHSGKRNHSIPLVEPVHLDNHGERPLDPYLLGVLLGDGHFDERFVTLTNSEPYIQQSVQELLPGNIRLVPVKGDRGKNNFRLTNGTRDNELVRTLRRIGLMDHLSVNKFIPASYLFAPVQDRIAILQGLLDTDGYCGGHTIEYSTSSRRLSDDFRFLVESLGGTVSVSERIPTYTYRGEKRQGSQSSRIVVHLPANIQPFRLARKLSRHIAPTKYLPRRYIDTVEFVGQKQCQCIKVNSSDHLYVTEHCIVTHNTFTSLLIAEGLASVSKKRIAYVDTELGTHFYSEDIAARPIHPEAFDFDALYSRSLTEAAKAIYDLDLAKYGVVVIDSVSHMWEAAIESYGGRMTGAGTIPLHAWGKIKRPYKELVNYLISAPTHVIICGRQKEQYKDMGGGELQSTGKVMKAEGETAYEPHILIRLEGVQDKQSGLTNVHAYIEKDRTGVLAGKVIVNPNFESIARPLLPYLGLEQAHLQSEAEAAQIDAEAIAKADSHKFQVSRELKEDFINSIRHCKRIVDLEKLAAEIKAKRNKLSPTDLAETRTAWEEKKVAIPVDGELTYQNEETA